MRINFRIFRDQANGDSQMTLQSATGSSLRPDLQLRAQDQLRLLFKGEEKGLGHTLPDALQVPPSCWAHAAAAYSWQQFAMPCLVLQTVYCAPQSGE